MMADFRSTQAVICTFFALLVNDINGEIYYAGTQRSTFYDANTTCHDLGGHVLRYGMDFVEALVLCHQYIYVWAGLPYYEQLPGCYTGNATLYTPQHQRQENKRVAICADFCSSSNFTHFGVATTVCQCYTEDDFKSLDHSNVCQIPLCPGNLFDICGMFPQAIVFKKVIAVEDIGSCHARSVYADGKSHRFVGYCLETAPFLCKVGDSIDVSCSLPESSTQHEHISTADKTTKSTAYTTTTIKTTVYTTTTSHTTSENRPTSSAIATTSKPPETSRSGSTTSLETGSTTERGKVLPHVESIKNDNEAMILGVTISIGLLIFIIISVIIVFKCRRKETLKAKEDIQLPPTVSYTNSTITDDLGNDISYNSVQFNDTESEKTKKMSKQRSQMCDQEFLFYDPSVFTGD